MSEFDMIIDSHAHVRSRAQMGKKHLDDLVKFYSRYTPWFAPNRPWAADDFIRGPDDLIRDMDRSGVDKAFLLGIYVKQTGVHVSPEFIKEAIDKYPERFVGFVSVYPAGGKPAVRQIEIAIEKLGMRGIGEFLPVYNGLRPNDRRIYPIYKRAEELEIPIIIHTGWTNPPRCYVEWQNPLLLDEIGERFPNLKVVMAHSGFHWYKEACMVAMKYDNMYMDLAGWNMFSLDFLARAVQFAKQLGLIKRVMWGTDYMFSDPREEKQRIIQIPSYLRKIGLEPYLDDDDVSNVLGNNSKRLLNLKD